jgi:hypothetical protein
MKLVLDTFCEIYDLIKDHADAEFWNFKEHTLIPGAVYVFGREQFNTNRSEICELVGSGQIRAIISNPHEGSDTLRRHCSQWGIVDLVKNQKILLIGGGDMDNQWPYLLFESFLPKVLDYDENIAAQKRSTEIYTKLAKPYKFLFLNGRQRAHRKYLLEKLQPILNQAIWTNLDELNGPTHRLDPYYEFDFYQDRVALPTTGNYIKPQLFNGDWGEIYLKPEPYIDTYFSVVTETVFDYPHSFRTEKLWKPIVMGHPVVIAASRGYLRDMHDLGFRTWGHLIDESYDLIDNNMERADRVAEVVKDLCSNNLPTFIAAAEENCKYNQQRYAELRPKVREEFPNRFLDFLKKYNFNE